MAYDFSMYRKKQQRDKMFDPLGEYSMDLEAGSALTRTEMNLGGIGVDTFDKYMQ